MTAKWQYKQAYEGVLEEVRSLKAENDRLKRSAELDDSAISVLNACIDDLNAENFKLRGLVSDLVRLPAAPCFDCFGCRYEKHHDCESGFRCMLVERARELGIEAE